MEETAEDKLKALSALFLQTATISQKDPDGTYTEEFSEHMDALKYSSFAFHDFPGEVREVVELKAGDVLVRSGSIPIICNVILEEFESDDPPDNLEIFGSDNDVFQNAVVVMWNYSFSSPHVASAALDDGRLVPLLLSRLQDMCKDSLSWTEDFPDNHPFVCIINNISMHDGNDSRLRQLGAFEVLLPFLQSQNDEIKLSALSALANIATDEQAHVLATSSDSVRFLLHVLEGTLYGTFSYGWTVSKVVRAVRQLARNDANKRLLVEEGALPLLVEGAKSESEEQKNECMGALWTLSLDKENAQAFLDVKLLDVVAAKYRSDSETSSCRRAAQGILWQLRHELEKMPKYRWWCIAQDFLKTLKHSKNTKEAQEAGGQTGTDRGHVMLSYQWDDQPVVKEICGKLRKNQLKVWMDVDNMEGSLPQAMAEAVEGAFVVLTCMSKKYKDSQACRQEACYAFDKRKQIIPLKMQTDYEPDGWLGLIVAGKLWYDFSKDRPFDRVIKAVQKFLGDCKTESTGTPLTAAPAHPLAANKPGVSEAVDMNRIKAWTANDVQGFLSNAGLSGPKFDRFTGSLLLRLFRMHKKDEDEFYAYVESNLQLDAFESDRLGHALEKLQSV
nr:hypothetical protein BaRGS_008377 [Batillaria attramentaria]